MLALQMLLGGAGTQIGWLIFAFGSIFFWMFAWQADLTGWRFRSDAIDTASGTAHGCRDTRYATGGSRSSRGTPVYENRYRYIVDGMEYDGRSYATGTCLHTSAVTVEYLRADPSYSRIRGMRRRLLGPWALLVALLPGAGLVVAAVGWRRGLLRLRLLRDGLPAPAAVVDKTPTNTKIMGRVVYRVTLEFTARDGAHRVTVSTTEPERLGDDKPEMVLFDPLAPERALPVDSLPGELARDHVGRILPGASRAYLFLPAVALVLNGWFAYRNWR